jgi:hypothetical protein
MTLMRPTTLRSVDEKLNLQTGPVLYRARCIFLETPEEIMQQAFEQLAELVGNLLAERWLSQNRPNTPTDTNLPANGRDDSAPKDVPARQVSSAGKQPNYGSSS